MNRSSLGGGTLRVLITLRKDRAQAGQIAIVDRDGYTSFGPVPCLGKSDNHAAKDHNNPDRDPELPFGDTPTGEYLGTVIHEPDSPHNRRSYGDPDETGRIPVILLTTIEGDTPAWRAFLHNRGGLELHWGPLDGFGHLRPTYGCVRSRPEDRFGSLSAVAGTKSFLVSITEVD